MDNALAAVQASQSMLMVAEKKAKDILDSDPFTMSRLSEEDILATDDMPTKMLWGPWNDEVPPTDPYHHDEHLYPELKRDRETGILSRIHERNELDRRAAEYLNLVEAQTSGPSYFTTVSIGVVFAAAPRCRCSRQTALGRRALEPNDAKRGAQDHSGHATIARRA